MLAAMLPFPRHAAAQGIEPQRGAAEESQQREDPKKPWIKLKEADAEQIRGIYLVSAIGQDDVRKQTERYIRTQVNYVRAPSGGGIIGAIIGAAIADAIINNQIQSRIERSTLALPIILDQLKDFDFREEFWNRLAARLESESRFMIADDTYLKTERTHLDVPEQVGRVPVDAVLDLDTVYYLSADLRVLVMRLSVLLQSRDLSKVYHRAIYAYDTPPVSQEGFEAAARAWGANEGAAFRAALIEGTEQMLHMLYGDMLGRERFAPTSTQEFKLSDLGRSSFARVSGTLVERNGERFIVRLPNGNLFSSARGARFVVPETGSTQISSAGGTSPAAVAPATLDDLKDLLPAAK
jgi:hypothetical protein